MVAHSTCIEWHLQEIRVCLKRRYHRSYFWHQIDIAPLLFPPWKYGEIHFFSCKMRDVLVDWRRLVMIFQISWQESRLRTLGRNWGEIVEWISAAKFWLMSNYVLKWGFDINVPSTSIMCFFGLGVVPSRYPSNPLVMKSFVIYDLHRR